MQSAPAREFCRTGRVRVPENQLRQQSEATQTAALSRTIRHAGQPLRHPGLPSPFDSYFTLDALGHVRPTAISPFARNSSGAAHGKTSRPRMRRVHNIRKRKQRRGENRKAPAASLAPIDAAFSEARRLHQTGQLADAERLCRQVLAADPRTLTACTCSGSSPMPTSGSASTRAT